MKKSTIVQSFPALFLIGAILFLSGCGGDITSKCADGKKQVPAEWVELKVPYIESDTVCTFPNGSTYINYYKTEFPELQGNYEKKLKSEGWEVTQSNTRTLIFAKKNGKTFSYSFNDRCTSILSKCASAEIAALKY